MLLDEVLIQNFRNFTDAQQMKVEPTVTTLIGKNEAGKTTILKALHRLNPANNPDDFNLTQEYPRRRLARDRRTSDLNDYTPVQAWFTLEDSDVAGFTAIFDVAPSANTRIVAGRTYGNAQWIEVELPFQEALAGACQSSGVDHEDAQKLVVAEDVEAATAAAKNLTKELREAGHQARAQAVAKVAGALKPYTPLLNNELSDEQTDAMLELLPKFFYFSSYELLPGECDLNELVSRVQSNALKPGDETMLSLLDLAGEEPQNLLDEDYDSRNAELQAASVDLSDRVFEYWKQNDALTVDFDTDMPVVGTEADGRQVRHRVLKVQLRDERHGGVTTNFATRSAGFQWFFSFMAAFSRYQNARERVVVLLDEPGTSLHGEAQGDFLRFIFGELGAHKQVLYTTHSQHMIDPTRYESMRAVHDQATREHPELGVVISPVSLSADRTTVLPVEAALGYSVAQHLFLGSGPHLAVEGSSDFVFLTRMSEYLTSHGRQGLPSRMSIIPVGGIGNMPAFVALLGRRLEVFALIDGAETAKVTHKVRKAAEAAGVDPARVIVIGEQDGLPATGDIEDLFTPKDYLWLYSRAVKHLTEDQLPPTPEPILKRISQVNGMFDHVGPAHQLTTDRDAFFGQIDEETLNRFEELLKRLTTEPAN
ncbi:AAA family ATPase [Streptomyces sp. NPDC049597]|uniref:AAA family ATPase n=1 Tax=Streptomyces sp. NPDC049597 TaxID=3155276 RepID=UPI00341D7358